MGRGIRAHKLLTGTWPQSPWRGRAGARMGGTEAPASLPLIPGGLLSPGSSSGEKAWAGQGWETRDLWQDGGGSSTGCATRARTG